MLCHLGQVREGPLLPVLALPAWLLLTWCPEPSLPWCPWPCCHPVGHTEGTLSPGPHSKTHTQPPGALTSDSSLCLCRALPPLSPKLGCPLPLQASTPAGGVVLSALMSPTFTAWLASLILALPQLQLQLQASEQPLRLRACSILLPTLPCSWSPRVCNQRPLLRHTRASLGLGFLCVNVCGGLEEPPSTAHWLGAAGVPLPVSHQALWEQLGPHNPGRDSRTRGQWGDRASS